MPTGYRSSPPPRTSSPSGGATTRAAAGARIRSADQDRGLQRFTVHACHSDSKVAMPKIAGLKLWLSYDQGKNWRSVVAAAG